jgi:hypothetical protein
MPDPSPARHDEPTAQPRRTPGPADPLHWDHHPIDLGFSLFGVYLRVVAGRERRSPDRREHERDRRPLGTFGNMLFAGSLSGVVLTVLIVVVLVYSSVLSE